MIITTTKKPKNRQARRNINKNILTHTNINRYKLTVTNMKPHIYKQTSTYTQPHREVIGHKHTQACTKIHKDRMKQRGTHRETQTQTHTHTYIHKNRQTQQLSHKYP